MRKFLIGVAVLALSAPVAHAQPGNGQGNGQAKGQAAANDANGKGNANARGNNGAGNRGNGGGKPDKQASAGPRNPGNGNGNGNARHTNDVQPRGNSARSLNGNGNGNGAGNGNRPVMQRHNGNGRQDRDIRAIRDDYYSTSDYRDSPVGDIFYDRRSPDYRPVDGCPPGLAKKNNGCMPPGLARKAERRYDRADWWDLPNMTDGRYRYYDGNLVRIGDGGRISGYYPLLAGALSPGQRWPNWFRQDPLPSYYQSYYDLGKAQSYRYADNTIYRIDPATQAITTVAALLTGNDIRVGQPMPSGYDVYNVPYNYRDRYRDGPDARYRYSDGYVYRIDPTTQLVQAVIELL